MECYEAIDLMEDAIDGRLPSASRPGFAEHMEECNACRNYMEQLRLTIGALERLPRIAGTSRRRSELIAEFRKRFRAGERGD
jgi:anti-sigma factor RsiW